MDSTHSTHFSGKLENRKIPPEKRREVGEESAALDGQGNSL